MKAHPFALVGVCATALLTAQVAKGFSIDGLTLSPSNVVPANVELRLTVDISTPGAPAWLYAPTEVSFVPGPQANNLRVDVYPTSGLLTVIGSLQETVNLGALPVGTCHYEVILHPEFPVGWGTRTNRGSFIVTEETSPALPVVSLELLDGHAAETHPYQGAIFWAEFRVVRTGPVTNALVVFLNTQQGSARLGEDYRLDRVTNGSMVRIPPGTNAVNVRLYPIDDDFYEGDETVFFHLIAPPPGSDPYEIDYPHSSVSMTIHDNDPVTTRLDITAPRDGQHFDAGSVIELRAQIIGPGSSNTWTVELFDGDQSLGTTLPGGAIWWDNAIGGPHVINARAYDAAGLPGQDTLVARPVTITVGPGAAWPVVRIGAAPVQTLEPCPVCFAVPAVFTVSRTGPTHEALDVYLDYDGPAEPGVDYIALPNRVTIPPGTNAVHVLVQALDDLLVEGPEIVRATIVTPELATLGYVVSAYATEAMVVINDDEPGAPEIRLDIAEPRDGAQFAAGFTLEVSALAVWTRDEVNRPVEFFAGEVLIGRSDPPQLLRPTIPGLPSVHTIFWTNPPPGRHTLTARFEHAPSLAVTSPPVNITVGAEQGTVVSIEATQPVAEEDSLPFDRIALAGVFTISRAGPTNAALPVYVQYSGMATPGEDYPALPWIVTIPAGAASTEIRVQPIPDQVPEGLETLVAAISNCPPPWLRPPCYDFEVDASGRDRATMFIRDDGLTRASLTITKPNEGANFSVGEPVLIEATAIDLDGYISTVEFRDGEQTIGTSIINFFRAPEPGTPIEHSFEWRNAGPGPHVLTARAGVGGRMLGSRPVRITVGPAENQPPAVAIVRPASGAQFLPDTPIEIVAEARDPDGYVPHAEFFADDRKIGECNVVFIRPPDPGQTQTFTFVWRHPTPGSHALTARITDDQGATAWSAPVEIQVAATAPAIVSVFARDAFAVEPRSDVATNTATFLLRRFGPTNDALQVNYTLRGIAENGVDYEWLSGQAVVPAGQRSVTVTVRPLADELREGIETVLLRLEDPPVPGPTPEGGLPSYRVGFPRGAVALVSDAWGLLPPQGARCVPLGAGLLHVSFAAEPGGHFRVEASSDLRNWETLFDALAADDALHFVDDELTGQPHRFYRLVAEPGPAAAD